MEFDKTRVYTAVNADEMTEHTEPKEKIIENADFETLAKYINAGFELYPCLYSQKNNCYVHTYYRDGVLHYGLYETEYQKKTKDRHGITDLETLQTLCTQTIKDEYGKQQKITLFTIFPIDNEYIIININTHKDKANGLIQWHNYIKQNGFYCVEHFRDLAKFPCYTQTPNGGKHLYFKFPYTIPNKIKNLASSIEVSGKNHPEAAAGSFRAGTKNGFYTLHGDFKNAPLLPVSIYEDINDEQPEPEKRRVRGNWNQTLEGIANKARQGNTSEGLIIKDVIEHSFIPRANNLLILDLDKGDAHTNKADGIANFIDLVQSATLNDKLKGYFENFPANFPCYAQTPNGGIRLYFKASYITQNIAKRFDIVRLKGQNIKLKYNTEVTATEGVYNGKEYIMHGTLEKAPEITLDLLDLLIRKSPVSVKKIAIFERLGSEMIMDDVNEFLAKETELDLNIIDIKFQRTITDYADITTCFIYYSKPVSEEEMFI